VLDSLLSTATFIFIGTLMPFSRLPADFSGWRLFVIIFLILTFKRLPAVLAFQRTIPAFQDYKQALFSGWVSSHFSSPRSSFFLPLALLLTLHIHSLDQSEWRLSIIS
jgi:NhaP-type Na+/H+ or K+/H+ antiporter